MLPKILLVVGCFFSFAQSALAEEAYVAWFFAAQGPTGNPPRKSHTVATFAKVERTPGVGVQVLESHTISWLPKSLNIKPLGPSETGNNFTLTETYDILNGMNDRIWVLGPYYVQPGLYEMGVDRVTYMQSGQISYRMNDRGFRPFIASNCIHAVTDLDQTIGQLSTGTDRGLAATQAAVKHLSRWLLPDRMSEEEAQLLWQSLWASNP